MQISNFRIEPADFTVDFEDLRSVREAVFVIEQNIPTELEWDTADSMSYHVIARDHLHKPIGTGRLSLDRKIGRLAVLVPWRNQGVGKAIIAALIEKANHQNWTEVTLHAQQAAVAFYLKSGFQCVGDPFMEAGIPHVNMMLKLEPFAPFVRVPEFSYKNTVDSEQIVDFEDMLKATISLICDAKRKLCIFSQDLDHALYGHPEIIKELKRFVIQSKESYVQIILQNLTSIRSNPHPLVELAQRLPSSFQFRMPQEIDDFLYSFAFVVNDCDGFLFRKFGDRYQGDWSPVSPRRNRQLADEFDRLWQRFLPCPEFRVLSL